MIAIDTNMVLRILVRDDETQRAKALSLTENGQVFVPDTVVLETEWVLRDIYNRSPQEICRILRSFFGLKNVTLSDPEKIACILNWHEAGMDFTDAFHLANCGHLKSLKTFDKDFIKRAKGVSGCVVSEA